VLSVSSRRRLDAVTNSLSLQKRCSCTTSSITSRPHRVRQNGTGNRAFRCFRPELKPSTVIMSARARDEWITAGRPHFTVLITCATD
jgi:hypothetical protein